MAKVSVNPIRTAGALSILLLSGCATLSGFAPGLMQGSGTGEPAQVDAPQPVASSPAPAPMSISESGAPLPKQAYDGTGARITYQPDANPYTAAAGTPVPAAAVAEFRAADALFEAERYRDARIAFRNITRSYPELSGPWVKLGDIAARQDYVERAQEHYRKAIEVNPDNVNAYMALALHLRRTGDFAGAQQAYVDALNLWKDFPAAHLNLAILYDLYLNRPELAQPHYEAYDFLTEGSNPKVANWLIEVRRRTGIETSFVDQPPALVNPPAAETPVAAEQGADVEPADKG